MVSIIVLKFVVMGILSPDPSARPYDNFLPTDVNAIVASSSDSEEEIEISYEGYEVLPQEFVDISNIEADDVDSQESSTNEETDIDINLNSIRDLPLFNQPTKSEVTELWNSSNSRQIDITMDSTKEEQIKNAMAGFKLPPSAIPLWATHIPEEEWKAQLKNKVALLNKQLHFKA